MAQSKWQLLPDDERELAPKDHKLHDVTLRRTLEETIRQVEANERRSERAVEKATSVPSSSAESSDPVGDPGARVKWEDIDKPKWAERGPSSFSSSSGGRFLPSHNHDTRYYTKAETDSAIENLAFDSTVEVQGAAEEVLVEPSGPQPIASDPAFQLRLPQTIAPESIFETRELLLGSEADLGSENRASLRTKIGADGKKEVHLRTEGDLGNPEWITLRLRDLEIEGDQKTLQGETLEIEDNQIDVNSNLDPRDYSDSEDIPPTPTLSGLGAFLGDFQGDETTPRKAELVWDDLSGEWYAGPAVGASKNAADGHGEIGQVSSDGQESRHSIALSSGALQEGLNAELLGGKNDRYFEGAQNLDHGTLPEGRVGSPSETGRESDGWYRGLKGTGILEEGSITIGFGPIDIGRLTLGAGDTTLQGWIRGNQSGALRVNTGNGWVDIGPRGSASVAHFKTDQSLYRFDNALQTAAVGSLPGKDFFLRSGETDWLHLDQDALSGSPLFRVLKPTRFESERTYLGQGGDTRHVFDVEGSRLTTLHGGVYTTFSQGDQGGGFLSVGQSSDSDQRIGQSPQSQVFETSGDAFFEGSILGTDFIAVGEYARSEPARNGWPEDGTIITPTALGVGTQNPDAKAHLAGSGAQLLLESAASGTDVGGQAAFTQTAGGVLNLENRDSTGSLGALEYHGTAIYPEARYYTQLGTLTNKWSQAHIGELVVETLTATERRTTMGGRFTVGLGNQLSLYVSGQAARADRTDEETGYVFPYDVFPVDHNNLSEGDVLHLEGGGQFEFVRVSGFPNTRTDGSGRYIEFTGRDFSQEPGEIKRIKIRGGGNEGIWEVDRVERKLDPNGKVGTRFRMPSDQYLPAYDFFDGELEWVEVELDEAKEKSKAEEAFDALTPSDNFTYYYPVQRGLDPTPINAWEKGTGMLNTGTPGTGFIDQYALSSLASFDFVTDDKKSITADTTGDSNNFVLETITTGLGEEREFTVSTIASGEGRWGFNLYDKDGNRVDDTNREPVGRVQWTFETGQNGPYRLIFFLAGTEVQLTLDRTRVEYARDQRVAGPSTQYAVRTGTGYQDIEARTQVGNLAHTYGYGVDDVYGLAAGARRSVQEGTLQDATWVSVDDQQGFRVTRGINKTIGQWDTSGVVTVGDPDESHLKLTPGDIGDGEARLEAFPAQTEGSSFRVDSDSVRVGREGTAHLWSSIGDEDVELTMRVPDGSGGYKRRMQLLSDGSAYFADRDVRIDSDGKFVVEDRADVGGFEVRGIEERDDQGNVVIDADGNPVLRERTLSSGALTLTSYHQDDLWPSISVQQDGGTLEAAMGLVKSFGTSTESFGLRVGTQAQQYLEATEDEGGNIHAQLAGFAFDYEKMWSAGLTGGEMMVLSPEEGLYFGGSEDATQSSHTADAAFYPNGYFDLGRRSDGTYALSWSERADESRILNVEGRLVANEGVIGESVYLGSSVVTREEAAGRVLIGSEGENPEIRVYGDSTSEYVRLFHSTSGWGIEGVAGNETPFQLGSTQQIGGWNYANGNFSSGSISLDPDEEQIRAASTRFGKIGSSYGIAFEDGAQPDYIYADGELRLAGGGFTYSPGAVANFEGGVRADRADFEELQLRGPVLVGGATGTSGFITTKGSLVDDERPVEGVQADGFSEYMNPSGDSSPTGMWLGYHQSGGPEDYASGAKLAVGEDYIFSGGKVSLGGGTLNYDVDRSRILTIRSDAVFEGSLEAAKGFMEFASGTQVGNTKEGPGIWIDEDDYLVDSGFSLGSGQLMYSGQEVAFSGTTTFGGEYGRVQIQNTAEGITPDTQIVGSGEPGEPLHGWSTQISGSWPEGTVVSATVTIESQSPVWGVLQVRGGTIAWFAAGWDEGSGTDTVEATGRVGADGTATIATSSLRGEAKSDQIVKSWEASVSESVVEVSSQGLSVYNSPTHFFEVGGGKMHASGSFLMEGSMEVTGNLRVKGERIEEIDRQVPGDLLIRPGNRIKIGTNFLTNTDGLVEKDNLPGDIVYSEETPHFQGVRFQNQEQSNVTDEVGSDTALYYDRKYGEQALGGKPAFFFYNDTTSSWGHLWSSLNMGPGSGMDSDTLDGHEAGEFVLKTNHNKLEDPEITGDVSLLTEAADIKWENDDVTLSANGRMLSAETHDGNGQADFKVREIFLAGNIQADGSDTQIEYDESAARWGSRNGTNSFERFLQDGDDPRFRHAFLGGDGDAYNHTFLEMQGSGSERWQWAVKKSPTAAEGNLQLTNNDGSGWSTSFIVDKNSRNVGFSGDVGFEPAAPVHVDGPARAKAFHMENGASGEVGNVLYSSGNLDLAILRNVGGTSPATLLEVRAPASHPADEKNEATLALHRTDDEGNSELLDLYANGYTGNSETIAEAYGLRLQKRGEGQYRPFYFDFYDGETRVPAWKVDTPPSPRLSLANQATKSSHALAAGRTVASGTGLQGGGDLTSDRTFEVVFGHSAGTAAEGNTAIKLLTDATMSGGLDTVAGRGGEATLSVRYGATKTTAVRGDTQGKMDTVPARPLDVSVVESTLGAGPHYRVSAPQDIRKTASPEFSSLYLTDALEVDRASDLEGLVQIGSDLLPKYDYYSNLGSPDQKFLTVNAAELWVETLVASERKTTIGGRMTTGIGNTLAAPLSAKSSVAALEHNNAAPGDWLHFEGGGSFEMMQVRDWKIVAVNDPFAFFVSGGDYRSAFTPGDTFEIEGNGTYDGTWTLESTGYDAGRDATILRPVKNIPSGGSAGGRVAYKRAAGEDHYAVPVARAGDPTPANAWPEGAGVLNTLTEGAGLIDQYALTSLSNIDHANSSHYSLDGSTSSNGFRRVQIAGHLPPNTTFTLSATAEWTESGRWGVEVKRADGTNSESDNLNWVGKDSVTLETGPASEGPYSVTLFVGADASVSWTAVRLAPARDQQIAGPTVEFVERVGNEWDDLATRGALGNLYAKYDYKADTFGAAFGDSEGAWIGLDPEQGFRIMRGSGAASAQRMAGLTGDRFDVGRGTPGDGYMEYVDGRGLEVRGSLYVRDQDEWKNTATAFSEIRAQANRISTIVGAGESPADLTQINSALADANGNLYDLRNDIVGDPNTAGTIAGVQSQADETSGRIDSFVGNWNADSTYTLSSVQQSATDNAAAIEQIVSAGGTLADGTPYEAISTFQQTVTDSYAQIEQLAEYEYTDLGGKTRSVGGLTTTVDQHGAQISTLASYDDGTRSGLAGMRASAEESYAQADVLAQYEHVFSNSANLASATEVTLLGSQEGNGFTRAYVASDLAQSTTYAISVKPNWTNATNGRWGFELKDSSLSNVDSYQPSRTENTTWRFTTGTSGPYSVTVYVGSDADVEFTKMRVSEAYTENETLVGASGLIARADETASSLSLTARYKEQEAGIYALATADGSEITLSADTVVTDGLAQFIGGQTDRWTRTYAVGGADSKSAPLTGPNGNSLSQDYQYDLTATYTEDGGGTRSYWVWHDGSAWQVELYASETGSGGSVHMPLVKVIGGVPHVRTTSNDDDVRITHERYQGILNPARAIDQRAANRASGAQSGAQDALAERLGYESYDDLTNAASMDVGIIDGAYLNMNVIEANAITSTYINVDDLFAQNITINSGGSISAQSGEYSLDENGGEISGWSLQSSAIERDFGESKLVAGERSAAQTGYFINSTSNRHYVGIRQVSTDTTEAQNFIWYGGGGGNEIIIGDDTRGVLGSAGIRVSLGGEHLMLLDSDSAEVFGLNGNPEGFWTDADSNGTYAGFKRHGTGPALYAGANDAEGAEANVTIGHDGTFNFGGALYTQNGDVRIGADVKVDKGFTISWGEVTGTGKPEDGATAGASWDDNISGQPASLSEFDSDAQDVLDGAMQLSSFTEKDENGNDVIRGTVITENAISTDLLDVDVGMVNTLLSENARITGTLTMGGANSSGSIVAASGEYEITSQRVQGGNAWLSDSGLNMKAENSASASASWVDSSGNVEASISTYLREDIGHLPDGNFGVIEEMSMNLSADRVIVESPITMKRTAYVEEDFYVGGQANLGGGVTLNGGSVLRDESGRKVAEVSDGRLKVYVPIEVHGNGNGDPGSPSRGTAVIYYNDSQEDLEGRVYNGHSNIIRDG